MAKATRKRGWNEAQRQAASVRMSAYWAKRNGTDRPTPAARRRASQLQLATTRANGHTIDIDSVPPPILLSLTLVNRQELIDFITSIETQGFRVAEMRIAKAG